MHATRALRLRREVLAELRAGELEAVAGAAGDTSRTVFVTLCQITCLTCVTVCATDAGANGGR